MSTFADYLGVDGTTRPLKIGQSFSWNDSPYHTLRCDFKPASVDVNQQATLEVGTNDDVSLTVPSEGESATNFRGSQKPHMKECVLIIDHTTGEITLERLGSQIQLKRTRTNGGSKSLRPPFPFDKKKLSPLSGGGTPTRSETPPTMQPPASAPAKNGHGHGNHHHHASAVGSMPTLESESEDSDNDKEPAPVARPPPPPPQPAPEPRRNSKEERKGPRASATVVAKKPVEKPVVKEEDSDSSASSDSESNSSSSSSSSDDSSDEDEKKQPLKRAPQQQQVHHNHNMPVIGDDFELPSAPVQAVQRSHNGPIPSVKRNILSQDLQLSDSDSDSD